MITIFVGLLGLVVLGGGCQTDPERQPEEVVRHLAERRCALRLKQLTARIRWLNGARVPSGTDEDLGCDITVTAIGATDDEHHFTVAIKHPVLTDSNDGMVLTALMETDRVTVGRHAGRWIAIQR